MSMGKFQGCTVQVMICMILACLVQAYANPVAEVRSMQVAQVVETTSTCDFEYGFCGWTQGEEDDFDWVIYGGRPAKINTGPVFDHTDGSGRYYMLMNASGRDEGETAVLISPEYPAVPAAGRCLVFYYHMHGRTMGTLRIYQILTDGNRGVVFQRDGDQGMDFRGDDEGWHKGRINLVSSTPYRLVIEGTVGWAARSYIALDDLTLTSTTCPNMPASCGTSQSEIRTRRILNGEASLPRQWPWQVLIKIYHATTGKTNQCGGTLIAPQWVLTAAHCIEDISNSLWITNRESITLSFEMNQGEWEQKEFTVHPVEILIHEERQVAANGMGPHDLLLLKLPYALTLDENVNVACLPAATDATYPGTPCVVSGFGRQHYQGHSSLRLQHAYVNILNDSTCSGYHGDDLYSEDNICAGSASDIAIDACAGDSGGPLVCLWDDQYVLTGVVSFGSKCGFRPYPTPGVYADVAYYRDWIDEHIQA